MPHTSVEPDRHYRFDPSLAVRVWGVHGFTASCPCGWQGKRRRSWARATRDAKVHRGWHKMQERGL